MIHRIVLATLTKEQASPAHSYWTFISVQAHKLKSIIVGYLCCPCCLLDIGTELLRMARVSHCSWPFKLSLALFHLHPVVLNLTLIPHTFLCSIDNQPSTSLQSPLSPHTFSSFFLWFFWYFCSLDTCSLDTLHNLYIFFCCHSFFPSLLSTSASAEDMSCIVCFYGIS